MLREHRILLDTADETGSPSGYGSEAPATTAVVETTEKSGDNVQTTQDNKGGNEQSTSTQTKEQTTTTTTESKQDTSAESTKEAGPLELDLKGFKEEEITDLREFAKTHNLTKEQAQAMLDQRQTDAANRAQQIKDYETKKKEIHNGWERELFADKEFGGQSYAANIKQVNNLITNHIPSLNNMLTKTGGKLPPSIMKDLSKLANSVYGEPTLETGNKVTTKAEWHPSDFYGKEQNGKV